MALSGFLLPTGLLSANETKLPLFALSGHAERSRESDQMQRQGVFSPERSTQLATTNCRSKDIVVRDTPRRHSRAMRSRWPRAVTWIACDATCTSTASTSDSSDEDLIVARLLGALQLNWLSLIAVENAIA